MTFYADNDSDNSSNSDQSQEEQKGVDNRRQIAGDLFDSDSDEDTKRIILSEKDKRYQKLKETIMNIRQSIERQNFASVDTLYDTLIKDFEKSKKVIDEHGIPSFFIRAIYRLEDRIKNFTAEEKKKLSSANSKSMNAILRKITKISANIKEGLKKFAENPTPTTEESGGEKTDSDFQSDNSNDSIHPLESNDPMVRRQFWLKKKVVESESEGEEKEKGRQIRDKKIHEFKVAEVETEREITIDLTYDGRTLILKEFVANRTQKHFDLKYTYQVLKAYLKHYLTQEVVNEEILIELIMILIPISVDYSKKLWSTQGNNANCMNREMWLETFNTIKELLKILKNADNRNKQYQTYTKSEDTKFYPENNIIESVSTFFCTIVVELNKAFQGIETQSEEQYFRIQDLYELLKLSEDIQKFYDSLGLTSISTRIAFLRLENMYFIHDTILNRVRAADNQTYEVGSYFHKETITEEIIHNLATLVYKNDAQNKTKAILYHIYHHAIHDRTGVARDYLLMSKITDNVINIDSTLQTFYNRVLVQLGLAYFRQGNFTEAFTFLNDLCSQQGKIKELIGQAQLRFMGVNERKKVLPQHQHINVEMVEIINFICSMLIEGPIIVQETHNKNVIARNFRRLLDSYNKSHYISPPEQNRDFVFYATKELQKGNWKGCYDLLIQMTVWKHLTGLQTTLENLLLKVKEQSFKSYLFQFKNTFDNLSLSNLVEKFELGSQQIKAITFKMISAQELIARVHTIENQLYIIFEHSDRTSLQGLSSRLIESVNQSQNHNQRILDKKIGTIEHQFQDENSENPQKSQQKGDGKVMKKKLNLVANKPRIHKKKY